MRNGAKQSNGKGSLRKAHHRCGKTPHILELSCIAMAQICFDKQRHGYDTRRIARRWHGKEKSGIGRYTPIKI